MHLRNFLAVSLIACASAAAAAGKPNPPKPDFSLPAEPAEKVEYDTENIFGQTDGSDINAQGEREVSLDVIGRFVRRGYDSDNAILGKGPYGALSSKLGVQVGVTDNFEAEFSALGDLRRIRRVPGLEDTSAANFNGFSTQFTYRLLERTRDNRFGLNVSVEPQWTRIADAEGFGQDAFSSQFQAAYDVRLIDGRLWYGGNLALEPQVGRSRATQEIERQSTFTWAHALSARIIGNTFLGVEGRYIRNMNGFVPNGLQGQAIYIGPTFYHQFSKTAYIRASWTAQVWGRRHNAEVPGHNLDLQDFEQQVARVKVGVNF